MKEQRRSATTVEMTRLGLSSIAEEETEEEIEEGTDDEEGEGEAGDDEDSQPANAGIPIKIEEDAARKEEGTKKGDASCVNIVNIRMKDWKNGEETMFRVRQTTPFGRIMDSFASHKGVNVAGLRFFFDDEQIDPDLTIADLDLEDGDQVDVFLAQTGC